MSRRLVALVPAHNEAASLPATIASLHAQTVQPNRVLVVSDNSTDDTVAVARALGVDVMETVGNADRKAGALNQALATLPRDGYVLAMDADTQLSPDWIANALAALEERPDVGGVGAIFRAPEPTTYLGLCQYLEWERYAEEIDRTGRTFVMSGTAALIRWEALEDVRERFGHWYDTGTITEDSRLSLDLQMCGWGIASRGEVVTETMPTWRMLWLQRRRWYLGALQNVIDLGWSRVTARYWAQQAMLTVSVLLMSLLITLTIAATVINGGPITPEPFWLAIGAIFAVERVATVWDQPWPRRLFAAVVVPELIYALVLQTAFVAAVWQKAAGSAGTWAHLTPSPKGDI